MRASPQLSISQFTNIVKGLLYISNRKEYQPYTRILNALIESAQTTFPSETFEAALEDTLANDRQDAFAETAVLSGLLLKAINDPKTLFPNQKILISWLLRNFRAFIHRHSETFNPNVYTFYYPLIDRSVQGIFLMNEEANQMLREYILTHQTGYFQDWLVRPTIIGNFDTNTYKLEPFISQYLGYEKFEELLYSQPPSPATTKLQGFFTKFKAENFVECVYDGKIIEVFSDTHTEFVNSPTYPSFPKQKSGISSGKLHESAKYEELKYAQWVTRIAPITLQEAIDGGSYHFSRKFTLPNFEKHIKAKIHCLVDDDLSFIINEKRIKPTLNGWAQLHTLDIGEHLQSGENEIIFVVRNVDIDAKLIGNVPERNPYEFIYSIQIWAEESK